jgi:hypothetical protein
VSIGDGSSAVSGVAGLGSRDGTVPMNGRAFADCLGGAVCINAGLIILDRPDTVAMASTERFFGKRKGEFGGPV